MTSSLRRALALVIGLGALWIVPACLAASDEQIIAEMQQRMKALQQRIIEAETLKERADLQKEIKGLLEETINKVSPKIRPMMEIGFKLVGSISDAGEEYTREASSFFESDDGDFRTIKKPGDITARRARIQKLTVANQKLLERINSMEKDAEDILAKGGVSAEDRRGFMTGFRNSTGKRMGALRALRTIDAKMLAFWLDALALLETEWGHWKVLEGDHPIQWDRPEAQKKFSDIVGEIQVLAERQAAAEKAIMGVR